MRLYKQCHRPISKRFIKPPLLYIESNLDRLGLLSPTHDQRSQQQSGQITLQPFLIIKSKCFIKATHRTKIRKIEIPSEVFDGGGLELVKPAREPASSRPKSCVSLKKKPHESCPFADPCGRHIGRKMAMVRHQLFPQKPPGSRLRFSRTGIQPSPGLSTIELPPALAESGAYPPDTEVPDSPRQCSLPLACRHPPEGHHIGARKRRTPGNTILSQPYRRRISTDRPNREEGSQLAASLEGEPGPTPAGKTLPYSYP